MKTDHDGVADRAAARGASLTQDKGRIMLRSVIDNDDKPTVESLGKKFDALFIEYQAARSTFRRIESEVSNAIDDTCPPEIIMRASDVLLFQFAEVEFDELEGNTVGKSIGDASINSLEAEANLRNLSQSMRERRLELIEARDLWNHEISLAEKRLRPDPALEDKTLNALVARLDRLVDGAIELRARTDEEHRTKARMAVWRSTHQNVDRAIATAGPTERLMWSLIRDLLDSPKLSPHSPAGIARGNLEATAA